METKTFEQIYADMVNYIISHQDRLTDFNDGSAAASLVESVAREIAELYVRTRVGYSSYLRALPSSPFGFEAKTGAKAAASVRFRRGRPFSHASPIAEGCVVAAGSLLFSTVSPAVILAGQTESDEVVRRTAYPVYQNQALPQKRQLLR